MEHREAGERDRMPLRHRAENILAGRMAFSLMIVAFYLLGRNLQIPWTIRSDEAMNGIQGLSLEILGNSRSRTSLFSLGLMPWVTSMIIVQVFQKLSRDRHEKKSPAKANRIMLILTMVIAVLQAGINAAEMEYKSFPGISRTVLQVLTAVVLIAGSFAIKWLSNRNTEWGVGGQGLLIAINTLGSFGRTGAAFRNEVFSAESVGEAVLLTGKAALLILVILILLLAMEGAEFRTTVRRVTINNRYADDDYIAVRLNPVGTMPVMYVMSVFTLPYYGLKLLDRMMPNRAWIQRGMQILNLNAASGVIIFAVVLWGLTVVLSEIFVGPEDIADSLMRQGDYLDDLEPGRQTRSYLAGQTRIAAFFSAAVTGALVLPMLWFHAVRGSFSSFYMAPMTVMILAGMVMSILEEVKVYRTMEQYRPFL